MGTSNRWRWRWLALASAVGTVGAGCGSNTPEPPAVQRKVELASFSGTRACEDLEQYLEDTASMQMRTQLEAARDNVPSWGWWGGWGFRGGVEGDATNMTGAAAPSASEKQSAPTDFTTTNNQVQGVDEADFVKNDGTRIFVLSGNKLYATRSWPASAMALQGKLEIQGWPRQMFLDGTDRAVVFSTVWEPLPMAPQGSPCLASYCGYYNPNTTKVTVVDVSDLTNLKVAQEYFLPGNYNNARKVGQSVRLVMSDDFNYPPNMRWYPEYTQGLWDDKIALRNAYDKLIKDNEAEIRRQTLADWMPAGRVTLNGVTSILPQDCGSFRKANAPVRLGTVTIATLNLATPDRLDRTTIIGEAGEIYSSATNLYVANRHWWWWPRPGQKDSTYVHKFDISDPARAVYVASGVADGHILDQFSMDENSKGFFRIATTINTREVDPNPSNWWGRVVITNRLQVMAENQGALEVVGASEDVGTGERITSSRMIEDTGYVVTFRQTDPLFVFDLADPTKPHKVGELQVPGFSSYIHPLDANHLLTIGTYQPAPDANGVTNWNERAVQLAIFDVTDKTAPQQTFMQKVGTSHSSSEAQWDHKAFNYFPAKKLLAIPFSTWGWGSTGGDYWSYFISDLRVFSVDANAGFTPKGALSLWDMFRSYGSYNWSYYWTPAVRRSVMADDFVYAISDAGLRVAHISDLSAPLATVKFDMYQEQY